MRFVITAVLVAFVAPGLGIGAGAEMNAAAASHTGFAFDLYARLRADTAADNLFLSPYSVSVALIMVAEGARGETAKEMGRVLRFPDSVRQTGSDASSRPWNLSPIHAGLAAVNAHLTGADRPDPGPVRDKIQALRQQLDEANREAEALEQAREWKRHGDAARRSQQLAAELNQLLPQVDQYEMRIANALWGDKTYPFLQSYIDTIGKYYKTRGIFALDFLGDYGPSIDRINAWVEEQTNQRIRNLIAKDVLSEDERQRLRLVVTNAVYFRGEWAETFPAAGTQADDFVRAAGDTVRVPMMHHPSMRAARYGAFNADGSFFATPREIPWMGNAAAAAPPGTYPGRDGFAILELPYKGGDLAMVLIVPRQADGLPAIEEKCTPTAVDAWLAKLEQRRVEVFVPRFRLEATCNLSRTLVTMGMRRAFTDPAAPDGAQFDGMCASGDPQFKLYISQVLHKAFVEVTEKGTEAAAATAVLAPALAAMPTTQAFDPTFRVDKPFLFFIRDTKSGTLLFIGRMTDPARA